MFDRLQKPFLTVETGEAYQPIRLVYDVLNAEKLAQVLDQLKCLEQGSTNINFNWYWKEECNDLHFESLTSFKRSTHALKLGTLTIRSNKLYINLPSFKRACIAVSFFHKMIPSDIARIHTADFINKVYGLDERLPHGFSELLKEEELDRVLKQRLDDYAAIQTQCENAASAEEAFEILATYTQAESEKRLPYAERYRFRVEEAKDPEIIFLAFYIFMRGRELVAIKRWLGDADYNLAHVAEETVEQVFGGMGIDLIE